MPTLRYSIPASTQNLAPGSEPVTQLRIELRDATGGTVLAEQHKPVGDVVAGQFADVPAAAYKVRMVGLKASGDETGASFMYDQTVDPDVVAYAPGAPTFSVVV